MCHWPQRLLVPALLSALLGAASVCAATLEKLSVEEMSRKSTTIVRGRVTSCAGETQGSLILTRCRLQVVEYWKGTLADPSFVLPGGRYQGLVQTFTGTPTMVEGQEYVLFLWTGKSGKPQVIGLSQGSFSLALDAKGGEARVRRAASTEVMLDKNGIPVADTPMDVSVSELKTRVTKALGAARQ
jgi:hypothetical protein